MSKNETMRWQENVLECKNAIKKEFKHDITITEVPKGKITAFSMEQAASILNLLEANTDTNTINGWLEKVRRYCEINRAKLITVSTKRFGDVHNARLSLEAMAVLMATSAYLQKNILHFNAASTICDALDTKYSEEKWLSLSCSRLVHTSIANPNYFVGHKYEV
jgi:hypothetical protein